MSFLFLASLGQSAVVVVSLAAYIPQWRTLLRSRSTDSVSLQSWALWLTSSLLSWIYSIAFVCEYKAGYTLLVTNSLATLFALATIVLVWRLRCGEQLSGKRVEREGRETKVGWK